MKTEEYKKQYLYKQVVNAKLFVDRNFSDNLTQEKIASKAFYSKFHFTRLFKSIYGKTPHQYLTSVRIEKAKKLLQEGLGTSQVCFLVGLSSTSSFKSLFKSHTKETPFNYQKRFQKQKQDVLLMPGKFILSCLKKKQF